MSEAINSLGAFGFWLFLAVVVVTTAWLIVRKAKIRQETLIRIAESGQGLDKDLIEKILSPSCFPIKKSYGPIRHGNEGESYDPIRQGNEGAGFFFFLGFCTIFAGLAWKGGISYPIVGLGIFAILWAHYVWHMVGKLDAERRNEKSLEGLK